MITSLWGDLEGLLPQFKDHVFQELAWGETFHRPLRDGYPAEGDVPLFDEVND